MVEKPAAGPATGWPDQVEKQRTDHGLGGEQGLDRADAAGRDLGAEEPADLRVQRTQGTLRYLECLRVTARDLEHDRAEDRHLRRDQPGEGGEQLRDRGVGVLVMQPVERGTCLGERGMLVEEGGEQRGLAGEQPVGRGARDAGALGDIVHREPAQAVARQGVEGGIQDAGPRVRVRLQVQGVEEVGAGIEVTVERGARDAGRGGDAVQRRGGILGEEGARGIQDSVVRRSAPLHVTRLDATYCLVQCHLACPGIPPAG